ncbi:MAG: ferredoxin [Nanoarchaeota archaeon]
MAKYKVIHFKKDCISCGACAAVNPEFWKMDEQGLAHLKDSVEVDDHYELEIDEKDKDSNQEAADVCPVNIIHVKKKEDEVKKSS